MLFAATADGGTMEAVEGTSRFELTLNGVTPQVVWFSDRPARQSGHIPVGELVESWEGYGFVEDPPNAALAVMGADDGQDTVVVELGSPELDEQQNTVRFAAEVLDEATGNLSHLASDLDQSVEGTFGPATLFIDNTTGVEINKCPIHTNTNCPGADLHGAWLSGFWLTGSDLSKANLTWANLRGTNLNNTNLSGADLTNADATDAQLRDANLSNANLTNVNLTWADLTGADMTNAVTTGATFCSTKMPNGRWNDELLTSPRDATVE